MDFQELKITNFYKQNKSKLQQNYPGINLSYLLIELASVATLQDCFKKLHAGVPLAYILEKSYFYKSEFLITPHVLVPRYETEVLVEEAVLYLKKNSSKLNSRLSVIDIGTGSGNIILSILQELATCSAGSINIHTYIFHV